MSWNVCAQVLEKKRQRQSAASAGQIFDRMIKAIGKQKPGECIISNISRISYGNVDTYLFCLDIYILPGQIA